LPVAVLVVAALGVFLFVRLTNRSVQASPAPDESPSAQGEPAPLIVDSEHPAEKPAPTLGRIGGVLPKTLVDPWLLAEKSRRTLTVFSDGRPVRTYRIALGSKPVGPKAREGDGRTPEGTFYVCGKNSESRFHRSLGLSYPSTEDAERGVRDKLISKREQRAIVDAVRHYRQPPWNTRLGGEIMIHGGGANRDWTQGCVALGDSDIDELFPLVPLGTKVEIRP
jgi:lipoprotein-anchoring transpeptidase ErfK/SrfK